MIRKDTAKLARCWIDELWGTSNKVCHMSGLNANLNFTPTIINFSKTPVKIYLKKCGPTLNPIFFWDWSRYTSLLKVQKKKTMQKWHSDEYNGKKSILVYSPNLVLQLDFKCIIHVIWCITSKHTCVEEKK